MKVVLHGGGNSRRGVSRAERLGVRCVEADVMLCFDRGVFDGALCVHPGGPLPRRTSEGHLAYACAEAQDRVEQTTGERPLRLEELLDEIGARGMTAMLESKVEGTVDVVAQVLERQASGLTILSFLGRELLRAASVARGCLMKHDPAPPVWQALQRAYGLSVYAPEHWYLSRRTVELAHARGIRVVPWDVDDPEAALGLRELGADAVISNAPEALLERGVCEPG